VSEAYASMLHQTWTKAIHKIVIFKTDRSNELVRSSVKLLAGGCDRRVTVDRANFEMFQKPITSL